MAPTRTFSDLEWHLTPEAVRQYILALEQALLQMQKRVEVHEQRIEKLEAQSRKDSTNSSKPPSSDSPFNSRLGFVATRIWRKRIRSGALPQ